MRNPPQPNLAFSFFFKSAIGCLIVNSLSASLPTLIKQSQLPSSSKLCFLRVFTWKYIKGCLKDQLGWTSSISTMWIAARIRNRGCSNNIVQFFVDGGHLFTFFPPGPQQHPTHFITRIFWYTTGRDVYQNSFRDPMSCMEGHMHRADMKHYTTSPHFSCRNILYIQIVSVLSQDHQVNHQQTAETKLRNSPGETLWEQVIFWGIATAVQAFLEAPSWECLSHSSVWWFSDSTSLQNLWSAWQFDWKIVPCSMWWPGFIDASCCSLLPCFSLIPPSPTGHQVLQTPICRTH